MVYRLPDGGPVRVRASNSAAELPTAAELEEGEIALNAADGVLYYQNQSGAIGPVGFSDAPSDETIYGRKDGAWVDITSPANLQVRRGTAAEVAAITPLEGEPVWATDTKTLSVGDGSSLGGVPLGIRPIAAYDASTVFLDAGDSPSDPDMVLVLPAAATYFVQLAYAFNTVGNVSDLSIYLPSASITYAGGVSANDLNNTFTIPVESPYTWARSFVCVTSAANVTISPTWSTSGDGMNRLASYVVAIQIA